MSGGKRKRYHSSRICRAQDLPPERRHVPRPQAPWTAETVSAYPAKLAEPARQPEARVRGAASAVHRPALLPHLRWMASRGCRSPGCDSTIVGDSRRARPPDVRLDPDAPRDMSRAMSKPAVPRLPGARRASFTGHSGTTCAIRGRPRLRLALRRSRTRRRRIAGRISGSMCGRSGVFGGGSLRSCCSRWWCRCSKCTSRG